LGKEGWRDGEKERVKGGGGENGMEGWRDGGMERKSSENVIYLVMFNRIKS
jgi:hypothetical protein